MARSLRPQSGGLVKVERQQEILDLFRDAGAEGLTKAAVAARLGLSARTVVRALQLFQEQGARFTESRDREGFKVWVLEQGPRWDERVSPEARLALQVALLALSGGGTEVWTRHLEGLQALLDERLSYGDRLAFQRLRARVEVHGAGEDPVPVDEAVLREVLKALSAEPVLGLTLSYRAASTGRMETREVVPHSLSHDLFGGGAFLLAWDQGKGAVRQFRLVRLEQARATTPQGLSPQARAQLDRARTYQIGGWVSDAAPQGIEVAIRDPLWARALLEDVPALPHCEVSPLRPGPGVIVRFQACEWQAPARWVLQFGPAAEVLGPPAFRAHVADRVAHTQGLYREEPGASDWSGTVQSDA